MPRRLRIHQPGGFYHVTMRGNHQRDIFFADSDRHLFNTIVARAIEKYDARVHAYCWMTNHIHLLMQVGDEPLGRSMRQIGAEYARLVDVDAYLLALVRYIHLNPVQAGLVDDVARYQWSSHHNYVGRHSDSWVTTSFALNMFGTAPEKAIPAYLEFVGSADGATWQPPVDDFNSTAEKRAPQISRTAPMLRSRQTLHELITEACHRFEVDPAHLDSPVRDVYLTKVRAWIAAQAVGRRVASLASVARALGRDEATLRYAMRAYPNEMD